MNGFGFKLTKNYAFEIAGLNKIRNFSDGISFLDLNLNLDLYRGDHCPRFQFMFMLINCVILEFSIYNINHLEEQEPEISDNVIIK